MLVQNDLQERHSCLFSFRWSLFVQYFNQLFVSLLEVLETGSLQLLFSGRESVFCVHFIHCRISRMSVAEFKAIATKPLLIWNAMIAVMINAFGFTNIKTDLHDFILGFEVLTRSIPRLLTSLLCSHFVLESCWKKSPSVSLLLSLIKRLVID